MNSEMLISDLKGFKGDNVFNPYSDVCAVYDKSNAPDIRSKNITLALESFLKSDVDSIWLGRDLGHKGGRRTGLALTDEVHLESACDAWDVELRKATKGKAVAERTAANIWNHLKWIDEKVFMWNVFPFHPYEAGNQFSNRSHAAKERDYGMQIFESLILILRPKKIIAIGNDAYNCSIRLLTNTSVFKVRHPSYGGEREFAKQIDEIYRADDL